MRLKRIAQAQPYIETVAMQTLALVTEPQDGILSCAYIYKLLGLDEELPLGEILAQALAHALALMLEAVDRDPKTVTKAPLQSVRTNLFGTRRPLWQKYM